ncbi:MAG TPA: hypothetical protein VKU39_23050 [Streptosporangiaceae bacterium]|nr:hypothetical protein [Streptosporangiaceae bacterium]
MRKLLVILLTALAAVTLLVTPVWASSSGPTVIGTGTLGAFGDPTVRVFAYELPAGAQGSFFLAYPDKTTVLGNATCLSVTGTTAYLTARITTATGPRAQANGWSVGNYMIIGIQDNSGTPDLLNFSPGFTANPGCGPNFAATPVFPIVTGSFRVSG